MDSEGVGFSYGTRTIVGAAEPHGMISGDAQKYIVETTERCECQPGTWICPSSARGEIYIIHMNIYCVHIFDENRHLQRLGAWLRVRAHARHVGAVAVMHRAQLLTG